MGLLERALIILCFSYVLLLYAMEAKGMHGKFNPPHKHTIQTIETEDGDIFDCIDINKQPSLDHPLARNHKIQMRPSSYQEDMFQDSYPGDISEDSSITSLLRIGLKDKKCPTGTIPIRRAFKDSPTGFHSNSNELVTHEASYSTKPGEYFGTRARLNVWGFPNLTSNKFTASQMCVQSGDDPTINEVCAGWMANPSIFGDTNSRFFVSWARDNYNIKGCVNLLCEGFVHINPNIPLGLMLRPASTYDGLQSMIDLLIFQDKKSDHWWVSYMVGSVTTEPIGYYPWWLFTTMITSATKAVWGGFVSSPPNDVSPPMGSGHFPVEGAKKAADISYVQLVDQNNKTYDLGGDQVPHVTSINCYKLGPYGWGGGGYDGKDMHYMFYFGGPGGNCQH